MARILILLLFLIHGIIHLTGFTNEFGLAKAEQFSGKTLFPLNESLATAAGILWLITSLLFILTAVLFFLRKEYWWLTGAIGLLLSQVLIIGYWHDAKFGTIVNIIILLVVVPAYGSWNFQKMADREIAAILPKQLIRQQSITNETIAHLPPVVRQWLIRSGVVGREPAQTVCLKQEGNMRTTPDGKWMSVQAEQVFTIPEPGFIWKAKVSANPILYLSGRDLYRNGKGHMLIKVLSLVPVVNSRGPEIDQGTLLRYLGESLWFPSAALSPYLKWEERDSSSVTVTMDYKGVKASGILRFTKEGDAKSFQAKRYFDRKEGPTLENWLVTADPGGYREFEGIRVPAKLSVCWKLKEGDFTWFHLEVVDIRYNPGLEPAQQGNIQQKVAIAPLSTEGTRIPFLINRSEK